MAGRAVTELRPFRALRYDPTRIELGRVLVPPYDVVNPDEREFFYDRDPYNAIRLELTRRVEDEAETDYRHVADTLRAWRTEGVLRWDAAPQLYGLRQRFRDADGEPCVRDGFFALVRIEDYQRRVVRPHERTLTGPKADRLKMLRATRANLSPVFFLYEDPEQGLSRPLGEWLDRGPGLTAKDPSDIEHTLVPLTESAAQCEAIDFLRDRPLVIADGHHRYETALAYRDECRARADHSDPDAPYEFILGYLANAYAPGTLLLPIHRVIREARVGSPEAWHRRLPGWRETVVSLPDLAALGGLLHRHLEPLADRPAFAADVGDGLLRVFSRDPHPSDDLSIRVIHREILGGLFGLDEDRIREGAVAFPKQASDAGRLVREGEGRVALYLNALRPEDVFRVTGAGEVLPQKSTFFFPKLPSGLLFRTHWDESP